jgi:hypothetical protein
MSRTGAVAILTMLFALSALYAADDALPGSDWLARAQAEIERSEYRFAAAEDGAFTAPNRAHDLRTRVTPQGIEVTSRTRGAFTLRLSASAWGRGTMLVPLGPGGIALQEEQVSLDRGVLVERYVNDSRGLEQLFDLPVPPSGWREGGPLVLEQTLEGDVLASVTEDGSAVLFRDSAGKPVARMAGLLVRDSHGVEVPAIFRLFGRSLRIEIDDARAVYPLEVDPLLTSPVWTEEPNIADVQFGYAVATAGDVNGDGFSDVLVGAPLFDGGQAAEGRVFLFLGSASGLPANANRFFEQNQADAHFGEALSTCGDLEGDGYDDFMLAAPDWDNGATVDAGAVFFYLGSSGVPDNTADKNRMGSSTSANFGQSLAWAGDVDRDFLDDVIIGAPFAEDSANTNEGRAFLYYGDQNDILQNFNDWDYAGGQANAHFGGAVGTAGDVNGDGYDDVIVAADDWDAGATLNVGKVFVFHGSSSGLSATPSWEEEFSEANAHFGSAVGTAGDLNGNGYADIVIGAYLEDSTFTDEGSIWIYAGSATGLGPGAVAVRRSGEASSRFGFTAATAGDVNGDGFPDVVTSAYLLDAGGTDRGRAYVYCGQATGMISSVPCATVDGAQDDADFGRSVAPAGDVNGDGYSDVIVGARLHDNIQNNEGRAFLYLGSGDLPDTTPNTTLRPTTGSSYEDFGTDVAMAGDVNGDGYTDVIVSDPQFGGANSGAVFVFLGGPAGPSTSPTTTIQSTQFNSGFGDSIDGAGDVNGDGYDDIVVGAPHWDIDTDLEDGNGRMFLYLGGPSGVNDTIDFQSTPVSGLGIFDMHAGEHVAGVGDVNGDGFADVLVGSGISEATAWVYYGSPTAALTFSSTDDVLGEIVQAAGDVNGDGYSDVMTIHPGSVFSEPSSQLFLGGPVEMDYNADWSRTAEFEASAFPAGDINGDGYSDVVLRTSGPSGGDTGVFFGGSGGLPATESQNFSFTGTPTVAGDVNGDGFADLLVGSGESLRIHLGSASGYSGTAAWTALSPAPGDGFATSFAGAGDVNGDGFDDVVAGAPDFNGNNAQLYLGGGGDGLDRLPRQRRASGTAPIALLGKSDAGDQFRFRAIRRHPGGRDTVGLKWETAPLGQPFGSGPSGQSTQTDTGAPGASGSATDTERLVTGLVPETVYRWRVRLYSNNPFFRGSKWLSVPGNNVTESDFRTGCLATTWFRDQDGDGFGNAAVTQSACTQPTGFVGVSGDCNDTNGAMFPGNPEICDGLDNNCAGGIDDGFVAPTGRPAVVAKKSAGAISLDWPAIPGADRYDVVRGGIVRLRNVAGDYRLSMQACIANDVTTPGAVDAATPGTSDGYFYLVRAVNCNAEGSYDEVHSRQVGLRDAEIEASGNACP